VIEPLELIATSADELAELTAFCHSSDLELLAIVVIAIPRPDRTAAADEQGAAA